MTCYPRMGKRYNLTQIDCYPELTQIDCYPELTQIDCYPELTQIDCYPRANVRYNITENGP